MIAVHWFVSHEISDPEAILIGFPELSFFRPFFEIVVKTYSAGRDNVDGRPHALARQRIN